MTDAAASGPVAARPGAGGEESRGEPEPAGLTGAGSVIDDRMNGLQAWQGELNATCAETIVKFLKNRSDVRQDRSGDGGDGGDEELAGAVQ